MIARLLAAVDSAVDTFLNAVVDRLIAAWLEEER
jgi:hypothetical protein